MSFTTGITKISATHHSVAGDIGISIISRLHIGQFNEGGGVGEKGDVTCCTGRACKQTT